MFECGMDGRPFLLPREPRVFHCKPSGPTAYLVPCQGSKRAFGLKGSPCHVFPGYMLILIRLSELRYICGKKVHFFVVCSRINGQSLFYWGLAKALANKKDNMIEHVHSGLCFPGFSRRLYQPLARGT